MRKFLLCCIITFLLSNCDPQRFSPKYNAILPVYLSDTSGILKLGDTLFVFTELPSEITDVNGNIIKYDEVKNWQPTFSANIIGDTQICYNVYKGFISKKSGISYSAFNDDNENILKNRKISSIFIAKDTGYFTFDHRQGDVLRLLKKGKRKKDEEIIDISLNYYFKANSLINELNTKYSCNKPVADLRLKRGIGYYAFKVIP